MRLLFKLFAFFYKKIRFHFNSSFFFAKYSEHFERGSICLETAKKLNALDVGRYLHLRKMNMTPLAILGVKWPFSKGRGI